MILDQLVLHNFGIYKGRHVINLTPPSKQKPIILFGALNGAGKTTLLDALQLALYGKLANCSNRKDLPYEEFLRRSINRGVPPSEGASLELQFRHTTEGKENTFRVHRSWAAREAGVRERLEVIANSKADLVLTEAWSEAMEDLIPNRLSKFFFFDGEKIEALADLERSAEVLSSAIHSLLGLDLVDQLAADLVVLERRKKAEQKSELEAKAIDDAQKELAKAEERKSDLKLKEGSANNELGRAQKAFATAEEKFRLNGGDFFERRKELELELATASARVSDAEDSLRELAGESAPLLLVGALLERVRIQDQTEQAKSQAEVVDQLLENRYTRALAIAEKGGASSKVVNELRRFFASDREDLKKQTATHAYLALSAEARASLHNLVGGALDETRGKTIRLLAQLEKHLVEKDSAARKLASAPDQSVIADLSEKRIQAREAVVKCEATVQQIRSQIEEAQRECEACRDKLKKFMAQEVEEKFRKEGGARVITHSQQVRSSMERFRAGVLERHIHRIESLILEGFQHLLRKRTLVAKLRIDPKTFSLELVGDDGQALSPERLSAGERQLLAVSMIWGLARASGRPIPAVIDTPLGRLDSVHREHLIERYFPMASHQVLLLSTDEEIDHSQIERLRPAIGRSYLLSFDERLGTTNVESGYFW